MAKGRDLNVSAPLQRWDTDQYYSPIKGEGGSIYARTGCFLDDISAFDTQNFKLTKTEALYVDPHSRILLEHTQVDSYADFTVKCQINLEKIRVSCFHNLENCLFDTCTPVVYTLLESS